MKKALWLSMLLSTSCAIVQPLSQRGTLVLKAQVQKGNYTKTLLPSYSKTSINHLLLKLYTTDSGEQDTGIQLKILNAQLDNPMVFANLKPNTHYRVRAYAYYTSDETQLISNNQSYADTAVGSDDRPTMGSLTVYLVDRLFNGQASDTITLNNGGYSQISTENMGVAGIEGIATTIAGSGATGSVDGIGTQASFNHVVGLAFGLNGNLYVSDQGVNRIRKITPQGVVSTFAGDGTAGWIDGTGTTARFNSGHGLVSDSSGNLYMAEWNGQRIRKIAPDGKVTTIAGSGVQGSTDGNGTSASFNGPHGLCLDGSGNIFVAEGGGARIRKIDTNGQVTIFAGSGVQGYADGTGTSAQFRMPTSIAMDKSGNFYIADRHDFRIRKMTPTGVVTTFAGSGFKGSMDGQGINAQLDYPEFLAFDGAGNLYVTEGWESSNCRIRKISPSGLVTTVAGYTSGYQDGTGYYARFAMPRGITVDASGSLYISDTNNFRIRKIL